MPSGPAEHAAKPRVLWRLDIYEGDSRANLLKTIKGENLFTTLGKQIYLDRMFGLGTPPTQINSMGAGTDLTAAAVTDNKLNPSVAGTVFFKAFDSLPTRSAQTVTAVTTYATTEANFSWNELGLANSTVNDGTHLTNRIAPVGPFVKTVAVSIVVTIQFVQA